MAPLVKEIESISAFGDGVNFATYSYSDKEICVLTANQLLAVSEINDLVKNEKAKVTVVQYSNEIILLIGELFTKKFMDKVDELCKFSGGKPEIRMID